MLTPSKVKLSVYRSHPHEADTPCEPLWSCRGAILCSSRRRLACLGLSSLCSLALCMSVLSTCLTPTQTHECGRRAHPLLFHLTLSVWLLSDRRSHRLTAIEGLEGLTELRELYLSHNVIENAHGLESQVRRTVERAKKKKWGGGEDSEILFAIKLEGKTPQAAIFTCSNKTGVHTPVGRGKAASTSSDDCLDLLPSSRWHALSLFFGLY